MEESRRKRIGTEERRRNTRNFFLRAGRPPVRWPKNERSVHLYIRDLETWLWLRGAVRAGDLGMGMAEFVEIAIRTKLEAMRRVGSLRMKSYYLPSAWSRPKS